MHKLKKIRLEKGLTQLLIILSELFGTSVDYLLDLTDAEKPYPRKTNP